MPDTRPITAAPFDFDPDADATRADAGAGTFTFLFTDVEGSTRLWEDHPDEMRRALARHDALLIGSVSRANGSVFKQTGDGIGAAFPTVQAACAAALAAQQALNAESWPLPVEIRVRMAIHVGTAEARGGDYYGATLNRIARLLAIGHGGQILLSQAAHDLARDTLPASALVMDMGLHRLKDLARPEQVYQLSDRRFSRTEFPALRSLTNPALPNNLPQQTTSFIGREKQLAETIALVRKARLVTLVGAGGSGKTRLALQIAAELLEGVGDGVWLVELAPLSDAGLVPNAVAAVLGIQEEAGRPLAATLTDALRARRLLLLLDNCEHVLDACARLTDAFLRACPGVVVLATSREPLGIGGEQVYRVPSLLLPDPTRPTATPQVLAQFEAVQLFVDRARLQRPEFAVSEQNAPAVAELCWRLDGIPMAIELAAARVRSLPVDEINGRLNQRFRLLTGGSRTSLPRQQTLRALIDWSWDLLTGSERTMLSRLSVFTGGWDLEAAEKVCSGVTPDGQPLDEWEVVELLTSLTDKSLAAWEENERGGALRCRLLETVRQYAAEKLQEIGQEASVRERHAVWFAEMAERARLGLYGAEQPAWLARCDAELDNLRAALGWLRTQAAAPDAVQAAERGFLLAGSLQGFWVTRGYLREGGAWCTEFSVLPSGRGASPAARARALGCAGVLAYYRADYAVARVWLESARELNRAGGDQHSEAANLNTLGNIAVAQGDFPAARDAFQQALVLLRAAGSGGYEATVLNNLGNVAFRQGDLAAATRFYTESLEINRRSRNRAGEALNITWLGNVMTHMGDYASAADHNNRALRLHRELGDRGGEANNLNNLAEVAQRQGDFTAAHAFLEQALKINREIGSLTGEAVNLQNYGDIARKQGDFAAARRYCGEALRLSADAGNRLGAAESLEGTAAALLGLGDCAGSARLFGAAGALRDAIGAPLPPNAVAERDERFAACRSVLGEAAFRTAFEEGRALDLAAAIDAAHIEEVTQRASSP